MAKSGLQDMRILLTVGNLAHMRSTVIPKLVGLFQLAYKCNMDEDLKASDKLTY